MNRSLKVFLSAIFVFALVLSAQSIARAQTPTPTPTPTPCDEVVSGLANPLSITQSNLGNLIVSETGNGSPSSGRVSIVSTAGNRRTLVDGLPSGINDVSEPSGPAGVYMRGRTLYLAMGIGDAIAAHPTIPGLAVANATPSSPLWSSILALHFSAETESETDGFTMTPADEATLAGGGTVVLTEGDEKLTIQLIANFPNFTSNVAPPGTVSGSNPFDLVGVGNFLYVTDGGQNTVVKVNIASGDFSTLATFPDFDNPLPFGPPTIDAVPTGISYFDGQLLVALFTGFPFPNRVSQVVAVDPSTGEFFRVIGGGRGPLDPGLKTAIDVIQTDRAKVTHRAIISPATFYVLEHSSVSDPGLAPPGDLLRFAGIGGSPVASCFVRPTSMVLDESTNTMYVTELGGAGSPPSPGRVVKVELP